MVNSIGSVQQFKRLPAMNYGLGVNQAQNGLNFGGQPQTGQNPLSAGQNDQGIFVAENPNFALQSQAATNFTAAANQTKGTSPTSNTGNDAAGILAFGEQGSSVTNPNTEVKTETNNALDGTNRTINERNEEIKDNLEEQKKKLAAVGSQLNITA